MTGTVQDFLDVAARNVGFIEGPRNNENPYAPLVGDANFAAWCASFVRACAKRAGVPMPKGHSAYTPTFANAFKADGRWGTTPKVGAVVFFEWPSMGRICHVGIVTAVNANGTISTIEGNTNSGGSRTGGMVCRLTRSSSIAGYGYPRFVEAPAPAKAPAKAAPAPAKAAPAPAKKAAPAPAPAKKANPYKAPVLTKARPALRASASKTKDEVRYVQWGVGVALKDVDGQWGAQTTKALKAFQTKNGLSPDGEVGPKTLVALGKVRR